MKLKKDLDVLMLEYHFISLVSPFAKTLSH